MRLAVPSAAHNAALAFVVGDWALEFRGTYAFYLDEVERNRDASA